MRPLRQVTTTRSVGKLTGRTRALERRDTGGAAVAGWNLFSLPGDNGWDWPGGTAAKPAWKLNPNAGKQPFTRGVWVGGDSGTSPATLPSEAGAPFDDDFVTALAFTSADGIAITKIDVDGVITIYNFIVDEAASISIDDPDGNFTAENVEDALAEIMDEFGNLDTVFQAKDSVLDTYAGISPSSNVQAILGAANYAAIRTLLALVIGTNVQAWDADLDAFSGLSIAANKLPYGTGSHTLGLADFTAAGRAIVDDADAAAQRTTLGLGTGALLASDTDGTLAANSDSNVPTQKAVKTYVDANIGGGGGGGGDPVSPGMKTGSTYYFVPPGSVGTLALTQNLLQITPVYLAGGITIDRIGIRATAVGGGTSVLRLGIYENVDGLPGALIVDGGTVAAGTIGEKAVTVSQSITDAGWYWLACVMQTATGATVHSIGSPGIAFPGMWTTFSSPLLTAFVGYSLAGVTGSLPNPFGSPPYTLPTETPRVYVRVT